MSRSCPMMFTQSATADGSPTRSRLTVIGDSKPRPSIVMTTEPESSPEVGSILVMGSTAQLLEASRVFAYMPMFARSPFPSGSADQSCVGSAASMHGLWSESVTQSAARGSQRPHFDLRW